jgi:hypothetical protein
VSSIPHRSPSSTFLARYAWGYINNSSVVPGRIISPSSTTKGLTRRGRYTLKYSASAGSDTEALPALYANRRFTMNFASDLRHFADSFLANIGSRIGSRIRGFHADTAYYEDLYAYPTKQYRWKRFVEKLSLVLDTCTGLEVFSFQKNLTAMFKHCIGLVGHNRNPTRILIRRRRKSHYEAHNCCCACG